MRANFLGADHHCLWSGLTRDGGITNASETRSLQGPNGPEVVFCWTGDCTSHPIGSKDDCGYEGLNGARTQAAAQSSGTSDKEIDTCTIGRILADRTSVVREVT